MKTFTTTLSGALVVAGLAITPAMASPVVYTGTLAGGSEVPPVTSPGTGTVTVTYDPVTHAMGYNVSFSGLLGTVTAAHVHCCVAGPGSAIRCCNADADPARLPECGQCGYVHQHLRHEPDRQLQRVLRH